MSEKEAADFIKNNTVYLPNRKLEFLQCRLTECKDINTELVYAVKLKNPVKFLIISIFLGLFGIDRFLIGDKILALLKLFTVGGFGLLLIFDWFYITKRVKEVNYCNLLSICYYNF